MARYTVYNAILENATEADAIDYARCFVWGEVSEGQQSIGYADLVDIVNGVGVYYDYAGDYYFFTNEEE